MILIEKKGVLTLEETKEVRILWNQEYPEGIAHASLEDTFTFINSKQEKTHYLIKKQGRLIAWSFTFLRSHQKWFSILVNSNYQKQGLGKELIQKIKEDNDLLCGWMVDEVGYKTLDGKPYRVPRDFYSSLGFIVKESSRFDSEKLRSVKIEWKKN